MVRLTDRLDMILVVVWDVKPQINQPSFDASEVLSSTFTVVPHVKLIHKCKWLSLISHHEGIIRTDIR